MHFLPPLRRSFLPGLIMANLIMTNLIMASLLLMGSILAGTATTRAAERFIVVQSTTSTQNSGLYDHILPIFTAKTGIGVRVVAVGTGQAIRNARNGDGDVLLVHARKAEEAFVADGHGVARHDLMYNDFVIVGPSDASPLADGQDVVAALKQIAAEGRPFLSRGDDSGTHKKEMALWAAAGIDPVPDSGSWYREAGSGMGATLNTGIGMGAYVLTDRATWVSFGNRRGYDIAVQGDPQMFNPYGVILVHPQTHPGTRAGDGQIFIDWLLSGEGQAAIGAYRVRGQQLFHPSARPG